MTRTEPVRTRPPTARSRRGNALVKLLVAAGVLGAAGIGAWQLGLFDRSDSEDDTRPTTEVIQASIRSFEITTTASGELQAMEQIEIRSPLERQSTIVELVPEGTRVAAGDVLAVLNTDDLETELEDDEIAVESERAELIAAENALEIQKSDNSSAVRDANLKLRLAELALQQWESGDHALKMQELELNMEEAAREKERLEEKHNRNVGLLKEGFISEDQYKQDELNLIKAQARVETVELQRISYTKYQQTREREQKESDVAQALAELDRVERQNAIRLADAQANLTSRQRRVARREAQIRDLTTQIEAATILAPSAGMVVYGTTVGQSRNRWSNDGPMMIGQSVYPNRLLFALPDTSRLVAEVRVHESLAGQIRPGQRAQIRVDAVNGVVFSGQVTEIGVLAENGGWLDPNLREYTVTIALQQNEDATNLKPSMRCEATLVLGQVDEAVTIPVAAVFNEGPVRYVYAPDGNAFRRVPVRTGRFSDTLAEIVTGIAAGDRVLLREPLPGEVLSGVWDEAELQLVGLALDEDGNPVRAAPQEAGVASRAAFSPGG
ncbi:MAG: HlyD family efflux transporter periplasmic adaptor subunit [Planctomycetota bacterium]